MTFFAKVHAKLGDLWWYTVLQFLAQRFADVFNVVVGLWLVPKYVPMEELGAVLPIMSVGGIVALPFAVVTTPFVRFLAVYSKNGELGKAKTMLRDAFVSAMAMSVVSFLVAAFVLPFFFNRFRVACGSLGLIVLGLSMAVAMSSIFGAAVQGLCKFNAVIAINAITAPLRLVVFVVLLPFRPISAYFVGQAAQPIGSIFGSVWACRKLLGKSVRAMPYMREDGKKILRYTLPVLAWTIVMTISSNVDMLLVRHRLPDFESAGYYVLTRFSEIAAYFGSAFMLVLFPVASTCGSKDAKSLRLVRHAVIGCIVSGVLISGLLAIGGERLLSLSSAWRPYAGLSGQMALLALNSTLGMVLSCLISFEMAQSRFGFMKYLVPLNLLKAAVLYCLCGYTFFDGILPSAIMDFCAALNPCRLSFLVMVFLMFNVVCVALIAVDVFMVRQRLQTLICQDSQPLVS